MQVNEEVKEEKVEMVVLIRHTLGDYCRRTIVGQMSLGFLPESPLTLDINNYVLSGLKDNSFEEK